MGVVWVSVSPSCNGGMCSNQILSVSWWIIESGIPLCSMGREASKAFAESRTTALSSWSIKSMVATWWANNIWTGSDLGLCRSTKILAGLSNRACLALSTRDLVSIFSSWHTSCWKSSASNRARSPSGGQTGRSEGRAYKCLALLFHHCAKDGRKPAARLMALHWPIFLSIHVGDGT